MTKFYNLSLFLSVVLALFISIEAEKLCKIEDSLTTSNVETLTQGEIDNPCGNVTYIPNEALREVNCEDSGTHKKCKPLSNVCCNPSEQTDCPPTENSDKE